LCCLRAVDPAGWNMLAVTVRGGERVVDHRMCLVPLGDYARAIRWTPRD
jgi:hypothetical protein